MSERKKWTPEPWHVCPEDQCSILHARGDDADHVTTIDCDLGTVADDKANAARIVKCVNGCATFPNPSKLREVVKAAAELHRRGKAYMEYHSRKYAENDMVMPTGIWPALNKMEAALAALEGRDDG